MLLLAELLRARRQHADALSELVGKVTAVDLQHQLADLLVATSPK